MKNHLKSTILRLLALTLIIGAVLSTTSCMYTVQYIMDSIINENKGESENEGGAETDNNGTTPAPEGDSSGENQSGSGDESGSGNQSGTQSGGNLTTGGTNLYPGTGSVDADKISPENRTLLSSVIITSHFGATPSAGSGVIYQLDKTTGDAYIITNYHVVYNNSYGIASEINLYLYGMHLSTYAIPATFVGGSLTYDIAVLKVDKNEIMKNSYAMAVTVADSDEVRVFDEVIAVGNPEAFGMSATTGIVNVDSEDLDMSGADGSDITLRVMRVSAAINEGNSGGGIFNSDGELIGIVCAKRIGSDIDNMAYAIPTNVAVNLAKNILLNCDGTSNTKVKRCLLGITITAQITGVIIDETSGEMKKAEIVEIHELAANCITGSQLKIGDRINSITVDGVTKHVTRIHNVIDHMLTARVGSVVTMNVTRGTETFDVSVVVPKSALTIVE